MNGKRVEREEGAARAERIWMCPGCHRINLTDPKTRCSASEHFGDLGPFFIEYAPASVFLSLAEECESRAEAYDKRGDQANDSVDAAYGHGLGDGLDEAASLIRSRIEGGETDG